ncbi:MAG: HEAT repeat domain-containing protein [candidate division Zixibacteria bacterium]|nr:HEAT repeat domain-containing protein [candidate division Zixibacteria bacterium]
MSDVIEQIGQLLARLQSPDVVEREEAVHGLGSVKQDEAIAGLVVAMEDPDLGIREIAADYLSRIGGDTASQLLIRFLANEDIGTRNLASEVLIKIGAEAVPALVENIDEDDHDVRKFICDVLGLIGHESATEALLGRLWDENLNVICSAAEALGYVGSTEALDGLYAVAERIGDATLQAIEAIGKIGSKESLDFLYKQINGDDPMVTLVAVEAVGQIGCAESVSHLAPFIDAEDRTTADAAMAAIIAISRANEGRIEYDLPLDKFTGFLFEGIRNRDQAITEFTLSRLSNWFGSKVISGLIDVIGFVEGDELKRITELLGDVGPKVAKPILERLSDAPLTHQSKLLDIIARFVDENIAVDLLPYVHHDNAEIRQRIAHMLGSSGFKGAVKDLKILATDTNGHVRAAAYSALGWLCSEADTDFIMGGLDDKYADVREAAVGALIIIGGSKVVAKLTADLYHDDIERQRLAVSSLGWIGEVEVVEPLLKAINHPDAGVRKSAIGSLVRIGSVPDIEPITLALNDENSGVRKAAITALLALRGTESVKDVAILLEDEDVWVRYHTISSLGDLNRSELAHYIMPYLEDDLDIIKLAAAKALAQMGCREAVPILNNMTDDRNEDLAKAARMALSSIGGK